MSIDRKFPQQVLIALAVCLALAAFPLVKANSVDVLISVLIGAVLSTTNVLAGFFAIERTQGKSYHAFLKAVLGGMGVRMAVMLGLIAGLIKFTGVHAVALVVSVLSFYVVFLVLELMYIQRRFLTKENS
ncbi:MAG: ATP synthase subunit I [Ignavibacteriae bacterium]|nr:ATP synthase subunit I [Ignavibacteriota bacterium]